MKGPGWLLKVAHNPVEAIIFIVSAGLMIYAVYMLSPFYMPNYSTPLASLTTRIAEYAFGSFNVISATPGLIAPAISTPRRRARALKLGSMLLFMSFFFLFVLRILVIGLLPMSWLPLLMISLICGVLRLYLRVYKR